MTNTPKLPTRLSAQDPRKPRPTDKTHECGCVTFWVELGNLALPYYRAACCTHRGYAKARGLLIKARGRTIKPKPTTTGLTTTEPTEVA